MEILLYAGEVARQVAVLFLLIAAGFALSKYKLVDERGADQFVNLLFYAVTPAVILYSFQSVDFSPETSLSLLIMAGGALLAHLAGVLVAFLVFFKRKGAGGALYRTSVIFSNCGFMSLPLADALLGAKGVFLVSVYVAVNNLIIWTVGVKMFSPGRISVKKALFNPGVVGILLGLPLFLLRIHLPDTILSAVGHLSNLNTPVAMLIIGFYLANASLKFEKGDGAMWIAVACRLCAVPSICLLLFWIFGIPGDILTALMIPASAPVAAIVMMFTSKFDGDTHTASRIVPISTLVSIFTMPVLLSLAKLVS